MTIVSIQEIGFLAAPGSAGEEETDVLVFARLTADGWGGRLHPASGMIVWTRFEAAGQLVLRIGQSESTSLIRLIEAAAGRQDDTGRHFVGVGAPPRLLCCDSIVPPARRQPPP